MFYLVVVSFLQIILVGNIDVHRLQRALKYGATKTVCGEAKKAAAEVKALTNGVGVDVAIECVGVPATFELCEEIIAPGGVIANGTV